MTQQKTKFKEQPSSPFLIIENFFKTNPEFYRYKGLLDVVFIDYEFSLVNAHLKLLSFQNKFRDSLFLVKYPIYLLKA